MQFGLHCLVYWAGLVWGTHFHFHTVRDQIMPKIAMDGNFQKIFVKATYIRGVYMTHVTPFENKNILREVTFGRLRGQTA